MRLVLTALALAGATMAPAAMAQGGGGGGGQGGGDMMSRIDTNKDGKVSLDEYKAFAETRWARMANGADKISLAAADERTKRSFAGITPDADGNVTKAAYMAAQPAAFKKADANSDGSLDAAEVAAMFPRPARPPAAAPAQ